MLTELTMGNLLAGGDDVDRRDFLARADLLAACGMTVLISDYLDYYRLAAYLAWRTDGRIGIVMGVPSLLDLFDESHYAELPGGILESFGRLFKNDLKLFVYPMLRDGEVRHGRHRQRRRGAAAALRLPGPPRAASSTWTTTSPTTCRSSAATCCGGSPRTTRHGKPWCRPRWPTLIRKRGFFGHQREAARLSTAQGRAVRRSAPPDRPA